MSSVKTDKHNDYVRKHKKPELFRILIYYQQIQHHADAYYPTAPSARSEQLNNHKTHAYAWFVHYVWFHDLYFRGGD